MNLNSVEADIRCAREVLERECEAIRAASQKMNDVFAKAVALIMDCRGKVVITGLGKSGHIAQKIASTLSSTGTPSIYLHPSEALHGDFGMLTPGDCMVAITYGGETREVLAVVKFAKSHGLPVIAMTGNMHSSLAKMTEFVLDVGVEREADTLGLAPTSSSTVTLALGDALAVTLMHKRQFTHEHFANLHPGGFLGRSLALVDEMMHSRKDLNTVFSTADFHSILEAVTNPNYGVVAVVDEKDQLIGSITDGDLRRALLKKSGDALFMLGKDLMNTSPKTVTRGTKVMDAISLMENFKITTLFVVETEEGNRLVGLLRLHDMISAKII